MEEFGSHKERKVRKGLKPETRNYKLTNQQAKPLTSRGRKARVKKEPGNPDKDLGTSSVAHKERRRAAYAILRIWTQTKSPNFKSVVRVCEMRHVVYSADIRRAKLVDAVGR